MINLTRKKNFQDHSQFQASSSVCLISKAQFRFKLMPVKCPLNFSWEKKILYKKNKMLHLKLELLFVKSEKEKNYTKDSDGLWSIQLIYSQPFTRTNMLTKMSFCRKSRKNTTLSTSKSKFLTAFLVEITLQTRKFVEPLLKK